MGVRRWPWLALAAALLVGLALLVRWLVVVHPDATPFDEIELVDASTLTVHYTGGSCDDRAEVLVEETSETVTLTVQVYVSANACDDMGHARTITAELDDPLGDRRLADGACDEAPYGRFCRGHRPPQPTLK